MPLTGFLRLSRSPNPAVKVGKKVRERKGKGGSWWVLLFCMPISGAYLFCNWRARSRSFTKTLTSSNFLFINGNGEKRACACVRVGGREEKNFLEEVEDNHLRFVCPTLVAPRPRPAGSFLAPKRQKVGKSNSISPSFAFFLSSLPLSLSLSLSLSLLSFLYGQIRLPAVGIITERKGGVGCCFWLFCFVSE